MSLHTLHVMVRYELEKELFDGTLQVKDLPAAWNDKMEAYLEFVRKMMHKVYCKMFTGLVAHLDTSHLMRLVTCMQRNLSKMLKDIPNFDALLEEGNITPIREWLTEHIHQYGKTKKPLEILEDVTGEGLNANYLADYLEAKYKEIYELKKELLNCSSF